MTFISSSPRRRSDRREGAIRSGADRRVAILPINFTERRGGVDRRVLDRRSGVDRRMVGAGR
jgi:hypothetical protein